MVDAVARGARACVGLVVLGAALSAPAELPAEDMAHGGQLYQLCATCHGEDGAGNPQRSAPGIAGLPAWYVETQLRHFKDGVRAYSADDATGLQMRPMAASLLSDEDLRAVAVYVAALPPVAPVHGAVAGDASKGQTYYAPCLACHGVDGMGNEALKAPPLVRQGDWYLIAQLDKFKTGQRGAGAGDAPGAQMKAMAATLPDQQAVIDVAAYVRTLGR